MKTASQFLIFSKLISLSSVFSRESLLPILPLSSSNELDVKMMLLPGSVPSSFEVGTPSPQAREVISHADGLSGVGGLEHTLGLDPSCSFGGRSTESSAPLLFCLS